MQIQKVNFTSKPNQQVKTNKNQTIQTAAKPYQNDLVIFSNKKPQKDLRLKAAALLLSAAAFLSAGSDCSAEAVQKAASISTALSEIVEKDENGNDRKYIYEDGILKQETYYSADGSIKYVRYYDDSAYSGIIECYKNNELDSSAYFVIEDGDLHILPNQADDE